MVRFVKLNEGYFEIICVICEKRYKYNFNILKMNNSQRNLV